MILYVASAHAAAVPVADWLLHAQASGSTQQIHVLSTRLASAKRPLPAAVAAAADAGDAAAATAAATTPDGVIGYAPMLPLNPADTLSYYRTVSRHDFTCFKNNNRLQTIRCSIWILVLLILEEQGWRAACTLRDA